MDSEVEYLRDEPAKQFDEIAYFYDALMAGVPYRQWIRYIFRIIRRFGRKPVSVLDLCCGTGSVSIPLAKMGFRVTGVDISSAMVEEAYKKAAADQVKVDFYVQDAAKLSLGTKFDLVLSLFDSLNYILSPHDLEQTFARVSEHLVSGGLFIFDMNTELALAGGLFDQDNLGCRMPLEYVWRSSYDPTTRICQIRMRFTLTRSGSRKQVEITHFQRAYGTDEITAMLDKVGLGLLATYDAYTFRNASAKTDRIFYVAEKPPCSQKFRHV